MSRPMALGLVLLVLILTSQSDWKREAKVDPEGTSVAVSKQQQLQSNHEKVNKQILLIQEKEIYVLKLRVKSLEAQLTRCQCGSLEDNLEQVPTTVVAADSKQADNQRDDVVESHSAVTSRLRGRQHPSSMIDDKKKPAREHATTLPLSVDTFEIAEEEEEKIEDK